MLRLPRHFSRRTYAAATSKQKRALDESQLKGASSTTAGASDAPQPGADSSSSSVLPLAAVGIGIAGVAAYFFTTSSSATNVEEKAPKEATKTSTTTESKSKADGKSAGNRVQAIAVPAKMKNVVPSEAASVLTEHPPNGNRVSMKPAAAKTDSSATEIALRQLQESQTEEAARALIKSHQSSWSLMEQEYFQDLDSLSNTQLKARIVQLATEMKDRTKWEAVRLKEFLAMKEKESADKYIELMQKQRIELEDLLAQRLREQEHQLSSQAQQMIQQKDASIQTVLKTALETQQHEHEEDKKAFEQLLQTETRGKFEQEYATKLDEYKAKMASELEQKVLVLNELTSKVKELEQSLQASQASHQGSAKAHRLSAAALAFAEKLESSKGAKKELEALRLAAGKDGVIVTAVKTIPKSVSTTGVPTLAELQASFDQVHKRCRQAAHVPEGRPGLEGQLAGILLAAATYPPQPDDAAPEEDKDNAEFVLVRAKKHLGMGDLESTVDEIEKLKGQVAFTVNDWKKAAVDRIAVERALRVIKMECALLNRSLAD